MIINSKPCGEPIRPESFDSELRTVELLTACRRLVESIKAKNVKRITIGILTGALLLPAVTMARPSNITEPRASLSPKASLSPSAKLLDKSGKTAEDRVTKLKNRATKEIDRRVSALNRLITKINKIKKLSTTQKTELTNQIQAQITSLATLKTEIASITDIETLKTKTKTIVDNYRIYALFIPKIHILTGADVMLQAVDKMTALAGKLQTKITEAQTAGKDITALQSSLTEMNTKTAEAKKKADEVIAMVLPLTPEGYPGNKTTLQSARTLLREGHQFLQEAHRLAQSINQGLRSLGKTTSPSPSP